MASCQRGAIRTDTLLVYRCCHLWSKLALFPIGVCSVREPGIGEPARLTRLQSGTGVSHRKQTPVDSLSDSHPDRSDLLCIEDFFNMHRLFGARPHSNTTPTHSRLRKWRWHWFCDFCLRFLSSMTSMISYQGGFFKAVPPNLKS